MQSFSGARRRAAETMPLGSLTALQREHVFLPFDEPFDIGTMAEHDEKRRSGSRQPKWGAIASRSATG